MDERQKRLVLLGEQAGQTVLSRRGLLKGAFAAGSLALLAACGSNSAATVAPGGQNVAATAATAGGASVAPAASSAASTNPAASSAGAGGTTTIVWYAGRDTTGYTPKQVEAFNNANKTLRIDYQEQGATTTDLHDKFVTVGSSKDPSVDIVSADVPFVPEFAAAGWTISLQDALSQSERDGFFKGTLDGATYQGKLYAFPWYNNGPGLYYRKDLFDQKGLKAPKTYDELLSAAKALQTPELSGFVMQLPQNEGGIINGWNTSGAMVAVWWTTS